MTVLQFVNGSSVWLFTNDRNDIVSKYKWSGIKHKNCVENQILNTVRHRGYCHLLQYFYLCVKSSDVLLLRNIGFWENLWAWRLKRTITVVKQFKVVCKAPIGRSYSLLNEIFIRDDNLIWLNFLFMIKGNTPKHSNLKVS